MIRLSEYELEVLVRSLDQSICDIADLMDVAISREDFEDMGAIGETLIEIRDKFEGTQKKAPVTPILRLVR